MQRDSIHYDVVIVGAGPSGLASAIYLQQLAHSRNMSITIAVLEKASAVGANILSGCILDPCALKELLPNNWESFIPTQNIVSNDNLFFLTKKNKFKIPHFKNWSNIGHYIISLSQLCSNLANYAEKLGVDIITGYAATDFIEQDGKIIGIITNDMGRDKSGEPTENFVLGTAIYCKQLVLAEGCRGSLTKKIVDHFNLATKKSMQTFGLGIKEIWQIAIPIHKKNTVEHFIGYPLNNKAYGGGFIYYMPNGLISIGLVSSLDYKNPYFSPYEEFQIFKSHPYIRDILSNATRIEYGARTVVEGGIQALPQLVFNGGLIVGDSAGFLNIARIKGVHNALKSGMLAAKAMISVLEGNQLLAKDYPKLIKQSYVYKNLYQIRNIRPAFRLGLIFGLMYTALEHYLLRHKVFWTFKIKSTDNERLIPIKDAKPIIYPKYDNVVSFDKASSLFLANIDYDENQPCHLQLKNFVIPLEVNLSKYGAPETKYCPAGVYEIIDQKNPKLVINAQNCVHCKACDIKDPLQNIDWTPPENGNGPQYTQM